MFLKEGFPVTSFCATVMSTSCLSYKTVSNSTTTLPLGEDCCGVDPWNKALSLGRLNWSNQRWFVWPCQLIQRYFCVVMNMREKQILTSVIEIQRENWSNRAFFKDNFLTILEKSFKIQSNVLIISEKCMFTPQFSSWIPRAFFKSCFSV